MEDKMIRISGDVHTQVKATAALYNMTIRDFTERALKKFILPDLKARTLVDTKAPYEVQEETPCSP